MLRAVIVDDEPRARSRLRRLLQAHTDVVVAAEAASGPEGMEQVLAHRPDVVFLDVRMPGPLGTEIAEQLQDYLPEAIRPAVVFTTAFAEHAVQAFAVRGLDYLLKPIERERLAESLRRVRERVWRTSSPSGPPVERPPEPVLRGIRGTSEVGVPLGAVHWIEVHEGVVFAHTEQARVRLSESLAELESRLPGPPFARVSRSAIVHADRVSRLQASGAGTYVAHLEGGTEVAVSRRRARTLRRFMGLEES